MGKNKRSYIAGFVTGGTIKTMKDKVTQAEWKLSGVCIGCGSPDIYRFSELLLKPYQQYCGACINKLEAVQKVNYDYVRR